MRTDIESTNFTSNLCKKQSQAELFNGKLDDRCFIFSDFELPDNY